jgi:hypothetical protein
MSAGFRAVLLATFAAWLAPAWAQPELQEPAPEVVISAENQVRMGVTVTTLEAQARADVLHAYVRAVDIIPLLSLASDIEVAGAAADASAAELARLSALAAQDQGASARDLERARSIALADGSRLDLLRRRLRVEWSADLARRIEKSTGLLETLSRSDLALVRADVPDRPEGVTGEVVFRPDAGRPSLRAEPVGLSGTVDPQLQTVGLYALAQVRGQAVVRPGRVFDGEIRTAEVTQGFLVPRSAVVRVGESVWAYVQTSRTTFQRRLISASRPLPDGWFEAEGFDASDHVAVTGAESLLAVERTAESPETD